LKTEKRKRRKKNGEDERGVYEAAVEERRQAV